jgi:outer membrane protein
MTNQRFFSPAPPVAASCTLLSVVLIAVLLAGGCAVDQRKEVAQYRQVLDGKNPPLLDDSFDGMPLSLEEALLLANRRNEQLSISGEAYVQSLIAKQRAYAAFLPTISLAPYLTYSEHPLSVTNGTKDLVTNVPVQANGNLFNGFRDIATLEGAGSTVEQRKAQLLDLQATIFLEVAQTYYQILSSERSVLVLTNSVAVQDATVADEVARERAGVARPLDVAQSEAQAASSRAQLISAEQDVANGRTMLAFLIDAKVDKTVLVDRLDVPDQLMPIESALATARNTRQDIIAARQGVEAARQTVTSALGEYYPTVSAQLDYYMQKQTPPTASLWDGLLNIYLPIFDSGNIYADVRLAWSQLRVARLNELQTVRQADEAVHTAYDTLQDSRRRIVELTTEVSASRDALIQAQQSYFAGLATNLDVLTAQNSLLTSQLALAAEQLNFKYYYLELLRSMGLLLRPEELIPATMPTSEPSSIETTTPAPVIESTSQPAIAPFVPFETQPTTQPIMPQAMPTFEPTTMPGQ